MKTNIKLGNTLIKTDVKGTVIEVDKIEFLLDFDSKLTILKDQIPDGHFDNLANMLNSINVTSEGVYNIDIFMGKISINGTKGAERDFNETINIGIQNITSKQAEAPLIEGVFTQTPTGNGPISPERLKELAEKVKEQQKRK